MTHETNRGNDPGTESDSGTAQHNDTLVSDAFARDVCDAEAEILARRLRVAQQFDDAEARELRERDDDIEAVVDSTGRFYLLEEAGRGSRACIWTRDGVAEVRQ